LWHCEQLALNSWYPSPVFAPAVDTCWESGMAGPPPSEAIQPAMSWISCVLNDDGLRSFSAPTSLAGIRPVDTWKSTAAAPAPIRLGACEVPWASRPWQLEQFA
jgi:hypothetical protein